MPKRIIVPTFSAKNGYFTTPERSKMMKKVRRKDTKEEIVLRKKLWRNGLRYRKDYKELLGTPDIVFIKSKVVVFVDGGFWHGYNWEKQKGRLKSNRKFWISKIERNMQRDRDIDEKLTKEGYIVLRFWSHQIQKQLDYCVESIIEVLHKRSQSLF